MQGFDKERYRDWARIFMLKNLERKKRNLILRLIVQE